MRVRTQWRRKDLEDWMPLPEIEDDDMNEEDDYEDDELSCLAWFQVCCSVLQRVAACCSVLQRVAVQCSVAQCVVGAMFILQAPPNLHPFVLEGLVRTKTFFTLLIGVAYSVGIGANLSHHRVQKFAITTITDGKPINR